ncbi:MAG: type I-C CRISPR-associated protein Cas8c/Csd1 [Acidobacteriota bacterium]|nr:type I-C CRISPR-associated protein Cas8c/Csd1 [Acidobacteriota bacterium]
MILQALASYYQRMAEEGGTDIAPEGFDEKEIPFLIILNQQGEVVGLQDTRVPSGKKLIGRRFLVPKEHERSGKNAWQKANLLWDHYGYVLAHPKSDEEEHVKMALKQHGAFVASVKTLYEKYPNDTEIKAVYKFLSRGNFEAVFSNPQWPDCMKIPGCNLSFSLEGQARLVCENESIHAYVVSTNDAISDDEDDTASPEAEGMCLVTGEYGPIERLHPRTPIPGAKSNAKIVAFQKNMGFDSYGKQQSYNAPISKHAASAYTTALKKMLAKNSRQKLQVGDATTVFWAEKKNVLEDVFAKIFGEPAKGEPEQDYKSLIAVFRSPETGARAELDPSTRFFVLGLAPNAARIAVRFWWAGTVGDIADNIWQHFDDMAIVHGPNQPDHLSLFRLLVSTAVQGKSDNIQPNLAGEFMKSILTGTPYPQTLLAAAIRRCRAEREITYPRAALLKAVLARETRYYERTEKEVGMSLDTTNTTPGYLLGRLFAVLEKVQAESAGGWGKINTTIRDRFYGAASSTPVTAFPYLMKLKNHHLSKLEKHKGYYEGLIGEIIDKLDIEEGFPTHLSLQDQGRFAIGYYHQRYAK